MAELRWDQAQTDANDDLVVPWAEPGPSDDWLKAFASRVEIHESETRAQKWDGIEVYTNYVVVKGLEAGDGPRQALADYLGQLIAAVGAG